MGHRKPRRKGTVERCPNPTTRSRSWTLAGDRSSPVPTWGPLPQPNAPVDVEVTSDREAVTVSSNRLRLRAERDPWQFTVLDRRGRVVCRQQRQDRAMMGFVAFPTGYSTDGHGAVAFHESLALAADEQLYGLGMQ